MNGNYLKNQLYVLITFFLMKFKNICENHFEFRTLAESAIIYSSSRSPRRSLGLLVSNKGWVGIETSAHLQPRKAEHVRDDSRSDGGQGDVVGCGAFAKGSLDLDCETF